MKPIRFTAKQKQMLNLPQRTWNIYAGAVRSGKSHGTLFRIPKQILLHYNEPCLFVGKTLATIERNVLRPLRAIYGEYDVGEIKGRADGGRYATLWGKDVDMVGANDERSISKIHGAEYGYIYCDELTLYPENFFRMMQSRLSLPDSTCDATCNPDSPSHYVKQFIDSDGFRKSGNYIHFQIYDNDFLSKEYIERLEDEYRGTIYFDRWILGNWVRTEGLVFPLFRREKHFLSLTDYSEKYRQSVQKIKYLIVGGDGATTNDSTALVPLAIFEDGNAAVLPIFYHNPKENGQLSNAELVPYMARWFQEIINEYQLQRGWVTIYTAVDCAAADLVLSMQKNLPVNFNVHPFTKKDILQTTDTVNNAFALDKVHIIDYGGYYNYIKGRFQKCISPLVVDLESMIWDEKKEDHYDDSIPNDCADAFRYALNTYYNNPDNLWQTPVWTG